MINYLIVNFIDICNKEIYIMDKFDKMIHFILDAAE